MGKHYQNLYSSLNRLQNFPLDLTTIYKTYADAETYVKKAKTKAYAGQVIAVCDEPLNNGIYVVINGADGLTLQKSADKKDLDALVNEINKTIKAKLDELDEKFVEIQKEINKIKSDLSDEFFNKIKETEEDVKKIQADLLETKNSFNGEITRLDKRIDDILGGDDIGEALDTIKEISDWIKTNEGQISGMLIKVDQNANDIKIIKQKNDEQDKSITTINGSITSLKDNIRTIEGDISAHDARISALEISGDKHYSVEMNAISTNAIMLSDVTLDEVEVEVVEPCENEKASFSFIVSENAENTDGENTATLISSEDLTDENTENEYSLVDITTRGRYRYELSYPIIGTKFLRLVTTAVDIDQPLRIVVRFVISKPRRMRS